MTTYKIVEKKNRHAVHVIAATMARAERLLSEFNYSILSDKTIKAGDLEIISEGSKF